MHAKLSHLTDEQYDELLELYYDPDKEFTVSQILESYDINARPSEFVSLLKPVVHEFNCPYCVKYKMISKAKSRSGYSSQDPYCPKCKHTNSSYCNCSNCNEMRIDRRQQEEHDAREIIHTHYGSMDLQVVELEELDIEAALFLKVILSHKVSENFSSLSPFDRTQTNISPTYELTMLMLKKLMKHGLICPDPSSDLKCFDLENYDGQTLSYYPTRVDWVLFPNLSETEKGFYITAIDDYIRYLEDAEIGGFKEAELRVWHSIVRAEAIEYYMLKTSELGFELSDFGSKTNAVFDDLANRFPLSQIYQIIFQATKNTHHYATTKSIPKYQTKNMFIGGVEKTANKYEAEGWLKDYGRDFNCPQTTISSVFFDWYLTLGSAYFNKKIPNLT